MFLNDVVFLCSCAGLVVLLCSVVVRVLRHTVWFVLSFASWLVVFLFVVFCVAYFGFVEVFGRQVMF